MMENLEEQVLSNEQIKYKKRIRVSVGVFLCLLSIFGAINYGPVSEFITWLISLFVGGAFSYVIYAVLLVAGLFIIINKKEIKFKYKLVLTGVILIYLGAVILFTAAVTTYGDGTYLSFANETIGEEFQNAIIGESFPSVDFATNTGLIGFVLVGLINMALTNIGSYIIGSFLIFLGLILATYQLLKKFFKRVLSKEYDLHEKEIVVEEEPEYELAVESDTVERVKEKTKKKKSKKEEPSHLSSVSTIKRTSANFDVPMFTEVEIEDEDIEIEGESNLERIDIETSLSKHPTTFQKSTTPASSDLKKALFESSLYNDGEVKTDTDKYLSTTSNDSMYDAVKAFAMGQDYLTVSMIMNTFNIGVNKASKLFIKLQDDGIIDSSDDDEEGNKVLIHSS